MKMKMITTKKELNKFTCLAGNILIDNKYVYTGKRIGEEQKDATADVWVPSIPNPEDIRIWSEIVDGVWDMVDASTVLTKEEIEQVVNMEYRYLESVALIEAGAAAFGFVLPTKRNTYKRDLHYGGSFVEKRDDGYMYRYYKTEIVGVYMTYRLMPIVKGQQENSVVYKLGFRIISEARYSKMEVIDNE